MEAFNDVGLEGLPLFLVGVVVLISDEISVCAMESEHQTVEFAVSGDGNLEVGVAK